MADQQSPNPTLWGASSIKQILLPEGWPSRSVSVETPVAALRASGSASRHIVCGVAAEMTARERDREMRQFGRKLPFYHHRVKWSWESSTTEALVFVPISVWVWCTREWYLDMGLFTDAGRWVEFSTTHYPLSSLPPKFSALLPSQGSLVATIAIHANRDVALSAKAHGVTSRKR